MSTITFEGVSFNKEWIASKTLAEFIQHEKHHGLSDAQLKEVYDLAKTEPKKEEKTVVETK